MNKRDRKEFEERLNNPEFGKLYDEFTVLILHIQMMMKRSGAAMTAQVPKAHELKEGKQTVIYATGERSEQVESVIRNLVPHVESLACNLSAFFPEDKRWRWQRIFLAQAFGGAGAVEQRQRGGRPQSESAKVIEEHLRMAEDWWCTYDDFQSQGEPPPTYEGFVESRKDKYKSISVSTLKRALSEYARRDKPGSE